MCDYILSNINRFQLLVKNKKNDIESNLYKRNKDIYQQLIKLNKQVTNKMINIAYSSTSIFIQYYLIDNDEYLLEFIGKLNKKLSNLEDKFTNIYNTLIVDFLVNFIQLCYIHTLKKEYLQLMNCIHVDLLFHQSKHIVHFN